ncbi:MAG TPA: hypothetical protein VG755_45965 [Nannocystaceae bacterium]|nr:hypothetical protein [Nannocystaceae bacterium]
MQRLVVAALAIVSCNAPEQSSTQAYQPSSESSAGDRDGSSSEAGGSEKSDTAPADSEGEGTTTTSITTTDAETTTSSTTSDGTTGEPLPEFDDVPWQTGDEIGYGVAYKDLLDPNAHNAFIGYAGYPFPLDASQSWVRELWLARLRELGVRHVWAVQGPATVGYVDLEVGNSFIAAKLGEVLDEESKVIVAAHSSGSYVAHELVGQLEGGLDGNGITADKLIYFNLDGGTSGLYDAAVQRLHRAYFVSVYDSNTGTSAPNRDAMQYLDSQWHAHGGYLELEGNGSGCSSGAQWCLHMVVINQLPHDPYDSDVIDYYDFMDRPVVTSYIDMVADDAGL